jgi:hypothetical protein
MESREERLLLCRVLVKTIGGNIEMLLVESARYA